MIKQHRKTFLSSYYIVTMTIRYAIASDRPAIVQLLKSSLGDSMIPKSEALWQWKHEDNPFGASYTLLAEEDGMLIGLRTFLQWQWQNNNGIYKAIRAVDTATHPNHQGKGLFKKLTLQLLDHCKHEGIDFVFNTPNEKSRPGYLKMGWIDQGPMPVSIMPMRILPVLSRKIKKQTATGDSFLPKQDWNIIQYVPNVLPVVGGKLQTLISTDYIFWRYGINPLFPYCFITDQKTYLLIYRMKSQGIIREMRITDIFYLDAAPDLKHLRKQFRQTAVLQKADIASISTPNLQQWKKALGPLFVKTKGPLVTLRQLAINDDGFNKIRLHEAWNYSLGDLELF